MSKQEKEKELTFNEQVEKSLRKKFHRKIFSKFAKGINEYQMLEAGDKVAVCISGGKDSMLMAKLFQELKRHRAAELRVPAEVLRISVDGTDARRFSAYKHCLMMVFFFFFFFFPAGEVL